MHHAAVRVDAHRGRGDRGDGAEELVAGGADHGLVEGAHGGRHHVRLAARRPRVAVVPAVVVGRKGEHVHVLLRVEVLDRLEVEVEADHHAEAAEVRLHHARPRARTHVHDGVAQVAHGGLVLVVHAHHVAVAVDHDGAVGPGAVRQLPVGGIHEVAPVALRVGGERLQHAVAAPAQPVRLLLRRHALEHVADLGQHHEVRLVADLLVHGRGPVGDHLLHRTALRAREQPLPDDRHGDLPPLDLHGLPHGHGRARRRHVGRKHTGPKDPDQQTNGFRYVLHVHFPERLT